MKQWCNCNSNWESNLSSANNKCDIQICGDTAQNIFEGHNTRFCKVCYLCKWYNPRYENDMFDLKQMNS